MSLAPMTRLLNNARRGGYAICYCESWNLESLQAVVEAAEELKSPAIAGFNGGFLLRPKGGKPADLKYYAALAQPLRKASIPVAFLLNETDSLAQIDVAIQLGFNCVMVENENLGLSD